MWFASNCSTAQPAICFRAKLHMYMPTTIHLKLPPCLQEKTKVKALSEELENPMNVHRWRKLEGSDPTTFEMIQKIHTLQKRLISKTEEVCVQNAKRPKHSVRRGLAAMF